MVSATVRVDNFIHGQFHVVSQSSPDTLKFCTRGAVIYIICGKWGKGGPSSDHETTLE